MVQQRFVVLDRDGTIIKERHYLSDPLQVELIPGVASGLRHLRDLGLGLVVITNQSAVGRGYLSTSRLGLIHKRLSELLEAEGVYLNGIYACLHTPQDDCSCRKPRTGLLELAARESDFESRSCFVIGDQVSDVGLGERAGATTFWVRTSYGAELVREGTCPSDYIVDSLFDAAQIIQQIYTP